MRELIERWHRGWCAARGLNGVEDLGDGLRVRCLQPGRDVEYVALSDAAVPELAARVLGEREVTWLTVATTSPEAAAEALAGAGLVLLKRAEQLMTVVLADHPSSKPADPYQLEVVRVGAAVTATVRESSTGEEAARGTIGLSGPDGVADRIETLPAHRRRGLASVVMGALAEAAREEGAANGILVASEDGQHLYRRLGWHTVADVLIATAPGG
ncbi:GNAT family N-acetyltransferase [Actinoplanes subtropicus]|uniref:GNAT family N-acetyltransferase n=1 Tax=Actinoplanes subtropicus TaxID=543632 RepID=UPI0004C3B474|nr:GNAT family N-acetyltransferase [Actinoplanes subtropicus]